MSKEILSQTPAECGRAAARGFGKRLKALRRERRIKQYELADQIGVHVETVRKWEHGLITPLWPSVVAIAAALGVTLECFLPE